MKPLTLEVGKAKLVEEGKDVTIVTYGMGVHWSKDVMDKLSNYSVASSLLFRITSST